MFRRIKNDNEENGENYIVNWKIMQKRSKILPLSFSYTKGRRHFYVSFFFSRFREWKKAKWMKKMSNKDQIRGKIMGVDLIFFN